MVAARGAVRPAQPGELCECGRPAVQVFLGGDRGDTGYCGRGDGGAPVDGVCTFCGDAIDHDAYARAEQAAGRTYLGSGDEPQSGRCPLYRLRLADPLPAVRAESVRPFDLDTDRQERSEGRLRQELLATLEAAGADYDGTYELVQLDENDEPESGSLDDVVFDICWATHEALARDHDSPTSRAPEAGQTAVAVMVVMLRARLAELGVDPNPLDGLNATALVDRAGGGDAWLATIACDRPLLIARRVARRALQPEATTNIYRAWS